jgi:hypothetical protein
MYEPIPVYDCGYRGRAVVVGHYNIENKTFVKHVDYLRHFHHNFGGFGYSLNVLMKLDELGCERLMHIETMGKGEDATQNIYTCPLWRYLWKGCYSSHVDKLDSRKNYTYDRRGPETRNDLQRFVQIKHWKIKKWDDEKEGMNDGYEEIFEHEQDERF